MVFISCAGIYTCQGRPGGRGHEFQDARTYAKWGLKYDWSYATGKDIKGASSSKEHAKSSYTTMRDAIYAVGRLIVFSICDWGFQQPWE